MRQCGAGRSRTSCGETLTGRSYRYAVTWLRATWTDKSYSRQTARTAPMGVGPSRNGNRSRRSNQCAAGAALGGPEIVPYLVAASAVLRGGGAAAGSGAQDALPKYAPLPRTPARPSGAAARRASGDAEDGARTGRYFQGNASKGYARHSARRS